MKRYENMNKEEIIKFIEDIAKMNSCRECPIMNYCHEMVGTGCSETVAHYLQEEISVKPRFMTFKSAEELKAEVEKWHKYCINQESCERCCYYKQGDNCMRPGDINWLCEEIETEG